MINVVYSKPQKNKIFAINLYARKKLFKLFSIVLILFAIFILVMSFLVTPIITKTGKAKVVQLSNLAMNQAIGKIMKGSVSYDDLITIITDSSGKISMLQANSVLINSLSRDITDYTYNLLFNKLNEPLQIPIGAFFGIPAFSSSGPPISFNLVPYGSVNCKFLSEFKSAGINQTVHRIYLHLETLVNVVLPFCKLAEENVTDSLFCESLIIGDIPDTYLMAETTSDLLNMV